MVCSVLFLYSVEQACLEWARSVSESLVPGGVPLRVKPGKRVALRLQRTEENSEIVGSGLFVKA